MCDEVSGLRIAVQVLVPIRYKHLMQDSHGEWHVMHVHTTYKS